jgi:hypothetical protein
LIGGITVIIFIISKFKKEQHLLGKGEKAEGIVFYFSDKTQTTGELEEPPAPYPIIRFVTKNGEWITEEYSVAHSFMKQGDKVKITYDPSNPRNFYVYTNHIDTILYTIGIIAGIIAIGYGLYKLVEYLVN